MSGRTWLVTGANGGIGLALTKQILARGDRVVATVRREHALADLQRAHPGRLHVELLDMTDPAGIRAVVARTVEAHGLDVVVSNAGYALFGAAEEVTDRQIEHQLATNLLGPIHLIRAVLPHFRMQRRGWIVQMSSEAGQTSLPTLGLYQASKWGIEGFCEAVAQETAALGIDLTLVCPGRIATGFDEHAVVAPVMADYRQTAAGHLRGLLAMGRLRPSGDPALVARAIIAESDADPPRSRLVLGSDAWHRIRRSLEQRLRTVDEQRESARGSDRPSLQGFPERAPPQRQS